MSFVGSIDTRILLRHFKPEGALKNTRRQKVFASDIPRFQNSRENIFTEKKPKNGIFWAG